MRRIVSGLNRRTVALVALAMVVAAVGVGFVLGYLPSSGSVTPEALSSSAENKKQDLLDGLAEGRILVTEYRLLPSGSTMPAGP